MEIKKTNQYDLFKIITGNRNINISKVEKIVNDINSGFNMLPYCPIIVSEKGDDLCIIDGQHRFEVSKQAQQPVYYVVCNDLSLKQIAVMNSRGDKWKISDFLNCYINLGIKDYSILKEFITQHQVQVKVAVDLLMFNKHVEKSSDLFQSGDFKATYINEANELLKLVDSIFNRYNFSKDKMLIGAVQQIKNKGKCDFEKLKQKIAMAPMMMDKNNDVKNYIYNIERVYNFKNTHRETII